MDEQLSKEILSELGSTEALPSIPRVVARALEIIDSPDVDLDDLNGLIGQDPSLSSAMLKAVNNVALGGVAGGVGSVREALVRMGLNEVKSLLIMHGSMRAFPEVACLDMRAFWRHSVATAIATGEMARLAPVIPDVDPLGSAIGGPYYLAGLLHDVGVLLLAVALGDRYSRILATSEDTKEPLWVVEEAELGFHHGTAGSALLLEWGLPEVSYAATEWHHVPFAAPDEHRDLARILHLADWITHHFGIGDAGDGVIDRFCDDAWYGLGLDLDQFGAILTAMKSSAEIGDGLLQWVSK